MNRSKATCHFFEKIRRSGGVESIHTALVRKILSFNHRIIHGICTHYDGPYSGKTTLSIGLSASGQTVFAVIVPGIDNYQLGDAFTVIPRGVVVL